MKRPTALQAEWERRLSADGLGERSLFQPHDWEPVVFVSANRRRTPRDDHGVPETADAWTERASIAAFGRQVAWHELAEAEIWQTLEHQAQSHPVAEVREFVMSYCEDGDLTAAARRIGVTRDRGRWLISLANRHWRLMQARLAPGENIRWESRRAA